MRWDPRWTWRCIATPTSPEPISVRTTYPIMPSTASRSRNGLSPRSTTSSTSAHLWRWDSRQRMSPSTAAPTTRTRIARAGGAGAPGGGSPLQAFFAEESWPRPGHSDHDALALLVQVNHHARTHTLFTKLALIVWREVESLKIQRCFDCMEI